VHHFQGVRGNIELAVGNGSAEIVTATCKNQTCMKMGTLRRAGQSLVCIPAQISVSVAGANSFGVDGITF
jgi:hypothetical protein